MPEHVHRCGDCHRPIDDPASIARGYGPDCWRTNHAGEPDPAATLTLRSPSPSAGPTPEPLTPTDEDQEQEQATADLLRRQRDTIATPPEPPPLMGPIFICGRRTRTPRPPKPRPGPAPDGQLALIPETTTMTHPPTPEQAAAIEAFATGDDLVIQAGAGTGKTSTLRMLAETAPRRRGLYIAFNRAIAADAKTSFPRNVECSTAHSLAYRAVGFRYKDRLGAPRVPARLAAEILGITEPIRLGDDVPILAPQQAARLVMKTVAHYTRSADWDIDHHHVPKTIGFTDPAPRHALTAALVPLARKAWNELLQPVGRLKFEHDHYLKLWQLSYPTLPADFVLFDEAQDADPVILSIVGNQPHAQRVVVGDSAQAIYEWRGALNAMDKFPGQRLTLSRSFRFGPAIATEANRWLTLIDAPLRLEGHPPIPSRIVPELLEPDAILCRSNAGAMREVMTSLANGRRTALVGGGEDIRRLAAAAVQLKAGAGCDHPELFAFRSWSEVQDYVSMDEGGSDLKTMVGLIDDYGPDALIAAINRLTDEPSDRGRRPMALTSATPDVVVSTVHKAKGREWPAVRIGEDFYPPKKDDDPDPAEARLAYVAVTRARDTLDRGALRWLDTYPHPNRPHTLQDQA